MERRERPDKEYVEERVPRYRQRPPSKFPILSFFAITVIVLGAGLLIFITSRKQAIDTSGRAAPELKELDLPDPPGYTRWDETAPDFIKQNKGNLVVGIYSYGQRSTVRGVTAASKKFSNYDVQFLIGDHDMCRIPVNQLASEGVFSAPISTTDCPVVMFFKDGKQIYKEKGMSIETVQDKIDELYHGGIDSVKEAGDILKEKTE